MADFWSSIALGGWGMPYKAKNYRSEIVDTSADGGRYAKIDEMIDEDGPFSANAKRNIAVGQAGIAPMVNSHGASMSEHLKLHGHKSTRKHFFISGSSASGGSGLHQGHREKKD